MPLSSSAGQRDGTAEHREQLYTTRLITTSDGAELFLSDCRLCGVDRAGEPPEAYGTLALCTLATRIRRDASLTRHDGDAGERVEVALARD